MKTTNYKVWDGSDSYILSISASMPEAQKLSDEFKKDKTIDFPDIEAFIRWVRSKGHKIEYTKIGGELYINDY